MTSSRLAMRRVLRSMHRRIRCDDNRRNRGFLVPAATRTARPHVRASDTATRARRTCASQRLARHVRVARTQV